jgi:hypothetical protein
MDKNIIDHFLNTKKEDRIIISEAFSKTLYRPKKIDSELQQKLAKHFMRKEKSAALELTAEERERILELCDIALSSKRGPT